MGNVTIFDVIKYLDIRRKEAIKASFMAKSLAVRFKGKYLSVLGLGSSCLVIGWTVASLIRVSFK